MPWHEPVPDGRSGPWGREPHRKATGGGYAFDPRCQACEPRLPRAWCAFCGEELRPNCTGYVHQDGRREAPDGHVVLPRFAG